MDKYECWDCKKEIVGVEFDQEAKKNFPRNKDGVYFLICKDCEENEEDI